MNKTITILIANYNNGNYFKECYNSIIKQTVQNYDVIILDDKSTDNSIDIINTIIKHDNRFKLYQNESNKGIGYTKRKLIKLCANEIFGFLDPDDCLEENAIEIMLNEHNANKKAGLVYSNHYVCDSNLEIKKIHVAKQINELNYDYYNFNGEISHFATFKKSIYNKTSGIDVNLKIAEDKDIYMKMCEVSQVVHINKILYYYRIHDGGISSSSNSERAYYWHWFSLMKMAERRNIDIYNLFMNHFVNIKKYDFLKKEIENSILIKIILKIKSFQFK